MGARLVERRGLVAPARLVRQLLGRRPIILPRHRPLVKPDQDFQDVVPVGAARGPVDRRKTLIVARPQVGAGFEKPTDGALAYLV